MVEGFEEVLRNELSKSLLQSQELGLDPAHKPPVHVQPGREDGGGEENQPLQSVSADVLGQTTKRETSRASYLTYSFLFSSVTAMFRPLGLSSCCDSFPKALCSTQNV